MELNLETTKPINEQFARLNTKDKTLHLRSNSPGSFTSESIAKAVISIPSFIKVLNLGWEILGNKNGEGLAAIFTAIPDTMTELHLELSCLSKKTGAELAITFAGIKPSITKLSLDSLDFGNKTGEELAAIFKALPDTVTELILESNALLNKAPSELAIAFAGIKTSVTKLNLRSNSSDWIFHNDTRSAFIGLPSSITELDLSKNKVFFSDFPNLPKSLSKLKLSGNCLNVYFHTTEEPLFKNRNVLEELITHFKDLPESVTYLDLSQNGFDLDEAVTTERLIHFLQNLPDHIREVNLGSYNRSLEERNRLRAAMIDRPYFLTGNGSELQPSTIEVLQQAVPVADLQQLVLDYLEIETPPPPPWQQPSIQAGFLLRVLAHPAIKPISCLFIIAGFIGIALTLASITGLAIALAGAASLIAGTALLTVGIFAQRKMESDHAANPDLVLGM